LEIYYDHLSPQYWRNGVASGVASHDSYGKDLSMRFTKNFNQGSSSTIFDRNQYRSQIDTLTPYKLPSSLSLLKISSTDSLENPEINTRAHPFRSGIFLKT
jgi:hypothetical protein